MKAFISYSHHDQKYLDVLHTHLAQLKRDGIINVWTDNDVLAGSHLDSKISTELKGSNLFISLLSPDYIASKYCYEKEFQTAFKMQEQGEIIIITIVVEPCDWLNTPFKKFKALPKDGKPISEWQNINTAFLDAIQNIRNLIQEAGVVTPLKIEPQTSKSIISRNYRVQKDFDSIEKIEFTEKTFHDMVDKLKRYIQEVLELDNIKGRILADDKSSFQCLLLNRNKINTESQLTVDIGSDKLRPGFYGSSESMIQYTLEQANRPAPKSFILQFDDYHLFWIESNFFGGSREKKELGSKEMADIIWNDWLNSIGIL